MLNPISCREKNKISNCLNISKLKLSVKLKKIFGSFFGSTSPSKRHYGKTIMVFIKNRIMVNIINSSIFLFIQK